MSADGDVTGNEAAGIFRKALTVHALHRAGPRCWRCTATYQFMLVCPECGNKRCPRANNHDNTCTGSNEAGQPGSAYA